MEYRKIDESLKEIKLEQAKNAAMILQAIKELNLVPVLKPEPELVPDPQQEWLLTEQVEKLFKKTARTIYSWRMQGKISCTIIGKTAYYNKIEMEKLLNGKGGSPKFS